MLPLSLVFSGRRVTNHVLLFSICALSKLIVVFVCKAFLHYTPLSPGQTIATCHRNIVGRNMLRAFGHRVATCCHMLGVVGLNLTIFKLEPTTANMSQHASQIHATCCAQQCCNMLCWHVAIVWPGLYGVFMSLFCTFHGLFHKIQNK